MMRRKLLIMTAVLMLFFLVALLAGRFNMSPGEALRTLWAWALSEPLTRAQEHFTLILFNVRLPRVLAAMLIGAALASSGAAYQSMLLNPLVSPGILGVLAGASFGAGLGIVFFSSWLLTQLLAFVFACAAVGLALLVAASMRKSSLLVLILGGMISASFFQALTSLLKFVADQEKALPELVYWLMGTFSRVDGPTLLLTGPLLFAGTVFLCMHGKIVNVLSMGEEEALSMGIPVRAMRLRIIGTATLISALTVALAGVVGWVGLVIPHILRFLLGPDNRLLLPASAMGGAVFMLGTDMLARNLLTAELPIGVFTSLISLPIFILSLRYSKGAWR